MKLKAELLALCCLLALTAGAQEDTTTRKSIREAYTDSIKRSTYPYLFPIWGQKVARRGIDLQLPAGVMLNYLGGSQAITISDLAVGFNDNPLVPLEFIEFGDLTANFDAVNARLDLWVLPFVDVYGIFGATFASTEVQIVSPFQFSSRADFVGSTVGCGITGGGKLIKGFVFILDYNNTWTTFEEIEGAVHTQNFGPRLGHSIIFKKRPDRNITLWAGASGLFVGRTTKGTIPLSDLSTDASKERLQEIKDETAEWYQGLTPAQKAVVKPIAEKLIDKIDGINIDDATVSYSLTKRPTSNWSMSAGAQFQLNHHWQCRAEAGFLGGRSSLLLSVNYRFGF